MDDLNPTPSAQPTEPVAHAPEDNEFENAPVSDQPLPAEAPVAPAPVAPVAPVALAPVASPAPSVASAPAPIDPRGEIPGLIETSDLSPEGAALATKRKLALEPKVMVMIPLDAGEKSPAYRSVIINGYPFHVRKNQMVEVPMSVANLIKRAYRMYEESLNENPMNLSKANEEKRRALGIS